MGTHIQEPQVELPTAYTLRPDGVGNTEWAKQYPEVVRRTKPLLWWDTVLENVVNTTSATYNKAKIICFGDSYMRYAGGGFIDNAVDHIYKKHMPATSVVGWRPVKAATNGWTVKTDGVVGGHGFGNGSTLSPGGESSITTTCRRMTLAYTKQVAGGGDLLVYWNNVLQTTIDTTDVGLATETSGFLWVSPLTDLKTNTLKVVAAGAGGETVKVDGALISTAERSIEVWNSSFPGNATTAYLVDGGFRKALDYISTVQPDLFVVALGHNDYAGGAVSFETNLRQLLTDMYAKVVTTQQPSLIINVTHQLGASRTLWPSFVDAMYHVADDYNAEVFDIYSFFGTLSPGSPYLLGDDTHYSNTAITLLASAFAETLQTSSQSKHLATTDGSRLFSSVAVGNEATSKATIGTLFNYPVFGLFNLYNDAQAQVASTTSGLLNLLGHGDASGGSLIFSDGTNAHDVFLYRKAAAVLKLVGGLETTAPISSPTPPTIDAHLTNKAYVDSYLYTKLPGWLTHLETPDDNPSFADEFDSGLHVDYVQVVPSGTADVTVSRSVASVVYANQAASDIASLVRPVALTRPFVLEAAVKTSGTTSQHTVYGVVVSNGALETSNVVFCDYTRSTAQVSTRSGTFTTLSTVHNTLGYYVDSHHIYFRLTANADNTWLSEWSSDGVSWTTLGLASFSYTMTPTHIGLAVSTWGTAQIKMAAFEYLRAYEL